MFQDSFGVHSVFVASFEQSLAIFEQSSFEQSLTVFSLPTPCQKKLLAVKHPRNTLVCELSCGHIPRNQTQWWIYPNFHSTTAWFLDKWLNSRFFLVIGEPHVRIVQCSEELPLLSIRLTSLKKLAPYFYAYCQRWDKTKSKAKAI